MTQEKSSQKAMDATKFSRNTAVPERPFPQALFVKLLKINKSKKIKHICIEI